MDAKSSTKTATLTVGNKTYDFPILSGTIGPDVIDIAGGLKDDATGDFAQYGDTLIERDQRYGYLETMLTLLNPGKDLTFRNLGWSGDTVAGLSRAGFDPPEAGYRQLIDQVLRQTDIAHLTGLARAT